jgi:hypothetical protein
VLRSSFRTMAVLRSTNPMADPPAIPARPLGSAGERHETVRDNAMFKFNFTLFQCPLPVNRNSRLSRFSSVQFTVTYITP